MKHLIFTLLLLFGAYAQAEPQTYLQLHGFSWHAEPRSQGKWNQANYGLGIRYETSKEISYQFGYYRNSVDKDTLYGVVNWTPIDLGRVRIGAFAGGATGYLVPFVGGGMINIDRVTIRIIPKVHTYTPWTFGFEYGVPF